MNRWMAWTAAAVFVMAAGGSAWGAEEAVAQVLALEHALCEAYLHGDARAMQRDLTDDYTLTNGRGEVSTKADDIHDATSGAIRYTRFENSEMKVRVYDEGRAAVVTGITAVAGHTDKGQHFDLRVRFTDTFVREGGRWRLAAGGVSAPLAAVPQTGG
jgi:uncharacterized protein (TIGR02246 family)